MLIQILPHTPLYVWAILALLIYRGVVAMRDREIAVGAMFVIPVIMLALSLGDIVAKFDNAFLPFCAWAVGATVLTLLVARFSAAGISAGSTPGTVRVHGSPMPLVMMLGVFLTKFVAAVALAILPHANESVLFATVMCTLFGCFNGYFLGSLISNVLRWQLLRAPVNASAGVPA